MHAVVVQATINDYERAHEFLTSQVVPQVSQAPGFVTGHWTRSDDNRGLSLIIFESEEAAQAVRQVIESSAPDDDAVSIDSVDVREVVANA